MKGVSGFYLVVIITIIIAIALIAMFMVFHEVIFKNFKMMFGQFVSSFLDTIHGILGPWAGIIMPGL